MNKQYEMEDILFALLMHDWIIIEEDSSLSQDRLNNVIFKINSKRYQLADLLKQDAPEKSMELYIKGIYSQFNSHIFNTVCEIYHKNENYDLERKFVEGLIENFQFKIDFSLLDEFNRKVFKNAVENIIHFTEELLSDDGLTHFSKELTEIKSILLILSHPIGLKTDEYFSLRRKFFIYLDKIANILIKRRDYIVKNQTFNKDEIHNNYYVWNS